MHFDSGFVIALLLAGLSGVAMAVQGVFNAAAGKVMGMWETTMVITVAGAVLVGVAVLGFGLGDGDLSRAAKVPWWAYLSAPIGVAIVWAVAVSIRSVGAVCATTAIIVGQVGMAAVIDHLGLFGAEQIHFSAFKIVGLILMAVGAKILLS